LRRLKNKGFAATNVVYGVGSYSTQYVSRDLYGFAVKATAGIVHGEVREIFKSPKTDQGSLKKSAKGFLAVYKDGAGDYFLRDRVSREEATSDASELKTVFLDGKLVRETTLTEIRARVATSL
jgi:nicotinamide phosphoribosyltransferase